ncbi:hypothetical protein PCC8801_0632 [Rippkaea orientalis PCC 8801]|uniref:Solute-binding protein family 3/N-terminal domain-containing protein n=1 Tax=Rippkaea orientalis (strain PCC 8801 / RF-1) TaxID=41431 RepID=B7JXG3_RIPO1|nr:transporter substrate-binding domain-containing protein [Rippkaea orientalis]ACK64720.1 hypothetical protein PCC8801_0632 [Rippkaea orientalis PCC 8801]
MIATVIQSTYVKVSIAQTENKPVKKVFYFGYSTHAYPVSLQDNNFELAQDTFCFELLNYLKDKYPDYDFKEYPTPFGKRLEKEPEKGISLAVGCDAYSITNKRRQYLKSIGSDFSIPYFITGFKYIVRKEQREIKDALINSTKNNLDFKKIGINDKQKIGVIENTTPHNYLENTYTIYNFELFPRRKDVLKALKDDNSKVVAYITDELLLKGILVTDLSLRQKYELIPEKPINVDMMGVIIHNPKFQYDINTWIEQQGRDLMKSLDNKLDFELKSRQNYAKIVLLLISIFLAIIFTIIVLDLKYKLWTNQAQKNSNKLPQTPSNPTISTIINIGDKPMNYHDQSQQLSIGGNVSDSSINQLTNASITQNSNNHKFLREVSKLEDLIKNETSLESEVKDEVLEKIEHLKEASQNPEKEEMKEKAQRALKVLPLITGGLKTTNEIVDQISKLIAHFPHSF